jgi:peptidoglycan/LPS O-acetylase OafA/YrhL
MVRRYETLDALRGLAALSVVLWHWQGFYFDPATISIALPDASIQPLYLMLRPFYLDGWIAVDLFFAISGFVFFYLYSERVADGQVSLWQFAINRFSRLYPLHIMTLAIIVLLQFSYQRSHGVFYGPQANDLRHFMLQLFLASNWWPTSPLSFNSPIWSVSIEVLLYALFFLIARLGFARPWVATVMAVAGALLVSQLYFLGRGIMSFYLGGLCFFVASNFDRSSILALVIAIVGSMAASLLMPPFSLTQWLTIVVIFPITITVLALNEKHLSQLTHAARWLGNISYSSYLLHIPLIFGLVLLNERIGVSLDPKSPLSLLAVFTLLIAISLASFHFFERPMQDWLRYKLGRRVPQSSKSLYFGRDGNLHHVFDVSNDGDDSTV